MTRRFRFQLEQILNYRQQIEDARRKELSQAKSELLRVQDNRKEHQKETDDFLDRFRELEEAGGFTVEEVVSYSEYKDRMFREEKRLQTKEKKAEEEVEKRRLEAVRASQERQLLKNLKEKQKQAHRAEVSKEEQNFLDDISSSAFIRRDRAERTRRAPKL
jgi:flagellar FliJ protein